MVIELNGERKEISHCWGVLKTKHYCRIMLEWDQDKPLVDRNYFKLFCILTDTEFDTFHATAENEVTIWDTIRWVIEQPTEFSKDVPKVLQIGDKIVDVPAHPKYLSIGQNIQLKNKMDGMNCIEAGISLAAAIFLQPIHDNDKFDIDKAMQLKEVIDEMPAYLIYPIGFFLLQNALKSGDSGRNNLHRLKNNLLHRLKRTLRGWLTPKGLHHLRTLQ